MPDRGTSWRSKLLRAARLTWVERFLIGEAALLILFLRVAVTVFGVRRVQWLLDAGLRASPREDGPPAAAHARALAISTLVDVASRYTVANTCLHRSLALWFLLERRGLPSQLRIGTRRQDGRFEAHAWVECGGAAVNDGGEPGYAPLTWPQLHHEA